MSYFFTNHKWGTAPNALIDWLTGGKTYTDQRISQIYILLQNVLINLGIHFSVGDSKLSRPWGSKAAPNHDAPSTILYSWEEVLMLVCCAFFSPHIVLCVPSKQLNCSFVCAQNILPVALWNIQEHPTSKLQTWSNDFFWQWLILWCPPMNPILV